MGCCVSAPESARRDGNNSHENDRPNPQVHRA